MPITYDLQKNWLDRHADALVENVEGKGCDLIPCKKCSFYIGDASMDHNCIVDLIEHKRNQLSCDHLCVRYMEKECITERDDEICDQPDMHREVGDVVDRLKEASEDAKLQEGLMVGVAIDTEEKFGALMRRLGWPNTGKKKKMPLCPLNKEERVECLGPDCDIPRILPNITECYYNGWLAEEKRRNLEKRRRSLFR